MNAATKHRAEQIISSFENSTTEIQYAYAEDIGDGRGITAGRAGFTSRTHDLLQVVDLRDGGFLLWPGVLAVVAGALWHGWRHAGLRRPLALGLSSGAVFWLLGALMSGGFHPWKP